MPFFALGLDFYLLSVQSEMLFSFSALVSSKVDRIIFFFIHFKFFFIDHFITQVKGQCVHEVSPLLLCLGKGVN